MKQIKEYKTSHGWVGKVIHWQLGERLKVDHINKWYMYKTESVQENETHWDFGIQTDHPFQARRFDLRRK